MTRLPRRTTLSFVAAAALATFVGISPAVAQDTVDIGVIANLTGSNVLPSVNLVRGAEAAAKAINADGGINGAQINLIIEDSEYRVQEALNAATKLYDVDGVQSAIMFGGSNLMIPVAEMARDKGRVLINVSSSSPTLADFTGTLFSVLPLDNIVGKALGEWAYDRGVRKAAFVVPNNAFGTGLMEAAAAAFTAKGGEVATKVAYTEGQPDYRAEVQSVVQTGPDAIIVTGYGDDSHKWFRLARTLGLDVPWYAAYPSILSIENPEWMDGKLFGIDNGGLNQGPAKAAVEAYKAEHGEDMLAHYLYAYDAIGILAAAMKAEGTDAADISAALPGVVPTFEALTGKIVWDEKNQRIDPPLDLIEYKDGQFMSMD